MKWFRWYRGSTENPKFVVVAAKANKPGMGGSDDYVDGAVRLTDVISVWAVILEDASNSDHWGYLKKDANFIAIVLRWRQEEVQQVLDAMMDEGLFDPDGHITKWEEYQYSSDRDSTNTARQRRYYNKHKRTTNAPDTKPNALAKRPDSDSDSDKEKNSAQRAHENVVPLRPDLPAREPVKSAAAEKEGSKEAFEQFWRAYPRRVGKKDAERALAKALREVSIATILEALARQASFFTDPKFTPHPASWLNAGRWADEVKNAVPKHLEGIIH